jgi:dephospho-CoA kinase
MSPKIAEYDLTWPAQAERVLARVRAAAGELALRADHIGSTAVPGLPAKDVLDLQVTVAAAADAETLKELLSDAGFPRLDGDWYDDAQDGGEPWPKRLHVGADPRRPVNLHVRSTQTPAWRLALLFRDFLRANPDERDDYRDVKLRLAEAHAEDGTVEAYADEKQEWVNAAFGRGEKWAAATGWTP